MAENIIPIRICVLNVDLQHCQACPKKVNQMLQKIKGVHGIYIDIQEGLVIVTGFLDPALLIKTIEYVGKRAELLAYEKNFMQANNKIDHYLKKIMQVGQGQYGCLCNSKDKNGRNLYKVKDHQPISLLENFETDKDNHDRGYADAHYMMPNMVYDPVSHWPNSISWHHPNYGMRTRVFSGPRPPFARQNYVYSNVHPMIYSRQPPPPLYIRRTRPPLPYPFSIYEQQEQNVGNAYHHIRSDGIVGACCIM